MQRISILVVIIFVISCTGNKRPDDLIIKYAKNKYGDRFTEGNIDMSDIFKFKWEKMYIFPPLTYPEDVENEIGINYKNLIVKDNHYLFLFVDSNNITNQFLLSNLKVGFSDNTNKGINKILKKDAKYKIKYLGKDNYWLYKIKPQHSRE